MRVIVLKCDQCNKTCEGILVPIGWYALEQGQETGERESRMHFCSLECLISWTSSQMAESMKVDTGGPVIALSVEKPLSSQLFKRNNMVEGE